MRTRLARLFGLGMLFASVPAQFQPTASQTPKPALRIDVQRDQIRNQGVRLMLKGWNAELDLTVDADVSFRASILLGEPIVQCSAQFTQVRGRLTFPYRDKRVSVAIGPDNAKLIDIHDAELLAEITGLGPHNHAIRCNPGVLGRPGREPFNVTSSPPWQGFLCRTDQVALTRAKPEHLGMPERMTSENWCKASVMGVTVQHYLPSKEEQIALLSSGKAQARLFAFGAMAVNVSDLIQAERKRLAAIDLAERLQAQAASLVSRARDLSDRKAGGRDLADIADTLHRATEALRSAQPAARAKGLQAAIRDVAGQANRPDADAGLREFLTHLVGLISDPAEMVFAAGLRDLARATDAARGTAGQELERAIALRREAGKTARAFAFGDDGTAALKPVPAAECPGQASNNPDWWYADAAGKCLYGPFVRAYDESDGLYRIVKDKAVYFMDRGGRLVLGPYYFASDFSEGLAVIGEKHFQNNYVARRHYIDKSGKKITEDYWEAYPFSEGYAVVNHGSKPAWAGHGYYYIDRTGTKKLGPYERAAGERVATDFKDGKARVRIPLGKSLFRNAIIDKNGKELGKW